MSHPVQTVNILTLLVLAGGCYQVHRIEGDGAPPPDVGTDAGRMVDAGTDAGRDTGPDATVYVPPATPRTERCDLARPPTFTGAPPETCERRGGDADGDGFPDERDCNDCSAQVNPGAYDFPGNDIDEDCDGRVDEIGCLDRELPTGVSSEAGRIAQAAGFCVAEDEGPGAVDMRLTLVDGTGAPDLFQAAVVDRLGAVGPARGSRMGSLSNGSAIDVSRLGTRCFESTETTEARVPEGVDISAPACPGVSAGGIAIDSVSLEVTLRVPTNAAGFRIGSNFFTREYPQFICSPFNDVFVMLRENDDGTFENLVFDEAGNPISVNNGLFEVCREGTWGGREYECPRGIGPLLGTGYELNCDSFVGAARTLPGGATDWLCTDVATTPGESITLRFAIWDSGDPVLSSLVLLDGFAWLPSGF